MSESVRCDACGRTVEDQGDYRAPAVHASYFTVIKHNRGLEERGPMVVHCCSLDCIVRHLKDAGGEEDEPCEEDRPCEGGSHPTEHPPRPKRHWF